MSSQHNAGDEPVDPSAQHAEGGSAEPPAEPHKRTPRRKWLWLTLGFVLAGLLAGLLVSLPYLSNMAAQIPKIINPQACKVNAKLVPSCNVLWGAAAGGFSSTPRDTALKEWEKKTGRTSTIYHTYHAGDQLFPTSAEIAMTKDATNPRILMTNWKVDADTTFAAVAAGKMDARIDRLAKYINATFHDKFFMVIHHEPENDIVDKPGSGRTPQDFVAMFRHTVQRLRTDGVTNAVYTVAYMGNEKWLGTSWWKLLYPGDDVVDWIAYDSYVNAQPGAYHYGNFLSLVDRAAAGGQSIYTWATTKHPAKPLMLAEWGVTYNGTDPNAKAKVFDTVLPGLAKRPAIKAMVYFDSVDADGFNIAVDSTSQSLAAFRRVAASPIFNVKIR